VTLVLIAAVVASSFLLDLGGILYVLANAFALWLFGPGVEDSLGRLRFLGFVVAGGLAAGLAQAAIDSSEIAAAAAAGAVAASAAGHLVLFPRRKVLTVSIVPFLMGVVAVPAVVYVALWCALQVVAGPGVALLAPFAFGLAFARTFVDPARDKRGMPPRIPAY
jgi:membrane associated rhomboid family serine protease